MLIIDWPKHIVTAKGIRHWKSYIQCKLHELFDPCFVHGFRWHPMVFGGFMEGEGTIQLISFLKMKGGSQGPSFILISPYHLLIPIDMFANAKLLHFMMCLQIIKIYFYMCYLRCGIDISTPDSELKLHINSFVFFIQLLENFDAQCRHAKRKHRVAHT